MDKIITLNKNEEKRIAGGHLWVFSNEIRSITGDPQAGDVVRVVDHRGALLGVAFYNPRSLIAARILSAAETAVDDAFFRTRIAAALRLRGRMFPGSAVYRLVHGESDLLPGLIIDRYGDFCAVQNFSFGMERHVPLVCDILDALIHPSGIVERNDASLRTLEGLEQRKGVLRGSPGPAVIDEEGLSYTVDLLEGQKTGFFLDQRLNRKAIRPYARDASVLDCFCNDGGFALNAACAGASSVTGIDISPAAVARAAANAAANGFAGRAAFIEEDVFDYLRKAGQAGSKFDLVILDPPSFARNRKTVTAAKKGYRDLHALAFRLLPPGGILATASCSHHIFEETFLGIIAEGARQAGRRISMLAWNGASPDHHVLPGMPETRYLKFGIFSVDEVL